MILEAAAANEAETPTEGPAVAEAQLQGLVDLLEDQLVAQRGLVEVAPNAVCARRVRREGLPKTAAAPHQGQRAGLRAACGDLVVGGVGKERVVRVAPAGGQRPVAGNKHPVIPRAHKGHEEVLHAMAVGDAEVTLAVERHVSSGDFGFGRHRISRAVEKLRIGVVIGRTRVQRAHFSSAPFFLSASWRRTSSARSSEMS